MSKSNNSSTKYLIIGSSTPLAAALEKAIDADIHFFGRSNPLQLTNWTSIPQITSVGDIESIARAAIDTLKGDQDEKIKIIRLIILSGVSSNDWQESVLVNEILPAVLSEALIEYVSSSAPDADTSITFIGSSGAYRGAKLPYSATKASLTGIMHSLNRKSPSNIRTNIVLPAAFNGGMIADWDNEKRAQVATSTLVGRIGTVEDITDAILFVANNSFVTDSILNITGGQVAIE